jgi:hypothetical protein
MLASILHDNPIVKNDREVSSVSTSTTTQTPWTRSGLVLQRTASGAGSEVVGDPCIVWDPDVDGWRMILFYSPPGHASSISHDPTGAPGTWSTPELLTFSNPEAFPMGFGTHKPFVVMDAYRPNRAARVNGKYWLLLVNTGAGGKHVQRAWADTLAGPWTLENNPILPVGGPGAIDELHVDVVSGFWFEDRGEFVYYYMANNLLPRSDQPANPFGASIAWATQRLGQPVAMKQGPMINPPVVDGHWASGYLGGIQIVPGTHHRWIGVINASPTRPTHDGSLTSEEPAPCLGGLAYTDEPLPTSGWVLHSEPIEWIDKIPQEARDAGEGTNFWRQHLLVVGDTVRLLYNSGFYGQEQMYSKLAQVADLGIAPNPLPTSKPTSGA